jgi:hypothetical protein
MGAGVLNFLNGVPVGHYRIAVPTGLTTGLAANAPIFSARWASANYIRALVTKLSVTANLVTPFTTAQEINAAAYIARSWSADDTGGTAIVLTAPTNMQNSLADAAPTCTMRAATAAATTAGTRTLDSNAILFASGSQTLAAASAFPETVADTFQAVSADVGFPINFQSGNSPVAGLGTYYGPEGIVATIGPTAQGAGGTVRYIIEMEWLEYNVQSNIGMM